METTHLAEKMAANEAKGGFIEKITFALLPLLFFVCGILDELTQQFTTRSNNIEQQDQPCGHC